MALLGLYITLLETVLLLIVLVVNIIVGPGCGQLVQSNILVIGSLRAWISVSIPIGCLWLVCMTGTIRHVRH